MLFTCSVTASPKQACKLIGELVIPGKGFGITETTTSFESAEQPFNETVTLYVPAVDT